MNTENLNSIELETLRILLNKMAGAPTPKVYLDPVNKIIDEIMDEFDFNRIEAVMEFLDWNGLVMTDSNMLLLICLKKQLSDYLEMLLNLD